MRKRHDNMVRVHGAALKTCQPFGAHNLMAETGGRKTSTMVPSSGIMTAMGRPRIGAIATTRRDART